MWSQDARRRIVRTVLGYERSLKGGPQEHRGRWPIMRRGVEVVLFELKTSLAFGGTADAYVREKVAGVLTRQADQIIEVEDDIGDREGTGADDDPYDVGENGKAMRLPGDPSWYVFDLGCP